MIVVDKVLGYTNHWLMNEYTLKLQGEKLDRLILEHQATTERLAQQRQTAFEHLLKQRQYVLEELQRRTGEPAKSEPQTAVLAAEKALNSNSSFLMRSRIEPLVDAIKTLVEKRNAILPADGSQSEESLRLRAILVRWNELCQALSDRAEALESAAAEKIKNREALRLWHAERKENAEATRQCAIDRAKCLASRKETQ